MPPISTGSFIIHGPKHANSELSLSRLLMGNDITILDRQEFVDQGNCFIRIQYQATERVANVDEFKRKLRDAVVPLNLQVEFQDSNRQLSVGVFASPENSYLEPLLNSCEFDESRGLGFSFIVSGDESQRAIADRYAIPFFLIESSDDPVKTEARQLSIVERYTPDCVCLVGNQRALSAKFLMDTRCAFIETVLASAPFMEGDNFYSQVTIRRIKMLLASAQFVTSDPGRGIIISQQSASLEGKQVSQSMVGVGRSLESSVLLRGLQLLAEHKLLVQGDRTIIFN